MISVLYVMISPPPRATRNDPLFPYTTLFLSLDYGPRDAPLALDLLITVGIGADRERSDLVAPLGEFGAEQLCRIGFGEQLALEIEPRRQVVKGVRRAREAIDEIGRAHV